METQIVFDKRSISPGSVRCAEFSCSDPFVSLMANKSDQGKLKKKKKKRKQVAAGRGEPRAAGSSVLEE